MMNLLVLATLVACSENGPFGGLNNGSNEPVENGPEIGENVVVTEDGGTVDTRDDVAVVTLNLTVQGAPFSTDVLWAPYNSSDDVIIGTFSPFATTGVPVVYDEDSDEFGQVDQDTLFAFGKLSSERTLDLLPIIESDGVQWVVPPLTGVDLLDEEVRAALASEEAVIDSSANRYFYFQDLPCAEWKCDWPGATRDDLEAGADGCDALDEPDEIEPNTYWVRNASEVVEWDEGSDDWNSTHFSVSGTSIVDDPKDVSNRVALESSIEESGFSIDWFYPDQPEDGPRFLTCYPDVY